MKYLNGFKFFLGVISIALLSIQNFSFASESKQNNASVVNQIFEKVKHNDNWKLAFLTAKDAQIVFMNITPQTNPKNEIGVETHKFDQIIFVVEGSGKSILNGNSTVIKSGDMIFIPQGVEHNVINLNNKKPLKILSVYSATDIPENTIYKKKSDAPQD